MDRYIKINKSNTKAGGFIGDVTSFNAIATMIDNNCAFCVYGPSGVGKTYMVHLALKNKSWVEVSSVTDIPLLSESTCHVVIDSNKIDKSILELKGKLSLGSTILITKSIENIDFCDCIKISPPTIDTLIAIGKKAYPMIDCRKAAKESDGDVRSFLFNLQFEGKKDVFKTSKDYIHDLLCSNSDITNELNESISDHGYIWDIVYTNHFLHVNDDMNSSIADSLSLADTYDNRIYNNSWDMLDHFWVAGVVTPISLMKRPLDRSKLKPGVAWTKFSNYKMRTKKLKTLPDNDICRMLLFMMKTLPYEDALKLLKSHNIGPKDVDVLNLLSLYSKIPVKTIKKFKTDLAVEP